MLSAKISFAILISLSVSLRQRLLIPCPCYFHDDPGRLKTVILPYQSFSYVYNRYCPILPALFAPTSSQTLQHEGRLKFFRRPFEPVKLLS
ncbi:hypothetical protein NEIMUCOT_06154 [Neisseria mucosa ATCC 25996]|uniref:Uncharacterized protein n=1 Tax=Neisseria mucosa (strain ATCC 25996 / DSM 4631 / NCTC 10774 / M26) TaxID=546266 RepID=D2ZZS2_NEIM2|nr:hypothetical protein NEIMUCOT_06154 [Neisseria mucosa ATCC 25996]